MTKQDDGFAMDLSIAKLEAGTYDILFTANGSSDAFASFTTHRSFPYYVQVTTDYDFSDPGNNALMYIERLHIDHPEMMITHFWAPYTYTDPAVTQARRDELTTWIKRMRDEKNDEIGLHIHPWCNFVTDAGLTCVTDQSTVYTGGDTSGYTIKLSAYDVDPMSTLLQHAKDIFAAQGLGTPITFRAGGWTADSNTLHALASNGFVADTSALNWKYIQDEWTKNGVPAELVTWNMTHWSTINDTSQPYYPSNTDPQTTEPGANISMLEVPDNGVMIDYVTVTEMDHIFDANFVDGAPLSTSTSLMMGFHPATGFTASEYTRVDQLMGYADMHLASQDLGPVVYIKLSDITAAFPAQ
jgi:hypothetical protein